jgi:hypothetical protein
MYVYFEFTVPVKSYSKILIFKMLIRVCVVADNSEKFSALFPTAQNANNFFRCCLHCGKVP